MGDIVSYIKLLGFSIKNGESNVYSKKYNDYEINIKYNEDYNQFYVVKIVNTNGIHRLGRKYN